MSLLPKRRSRSETRTSEINKDNGDALRNNVKNHQLGKIRTNPQNIQFSHMELSMGGSMGKRRTSAEMISEAKTFLSDVGGGSGVSMNNLNHHQPHQPPASGKRRMCFAFIRENYK